jgi:hypothetical protein
MVNPRLYRMQAGQNHDDPGHLFVQAAEDRPHAFIERQQRQQRQQRRDVEQVKKAERFCLSPAKYKTQGAGCSRAILMGR